MQPYRHIKNFVEKETAQFLYEYLEFSSKVHLTNDSGWGDDDMVPGCIGNRCEDLPFEAFLKFVQKRVEGLTDLKLFPTYSFARIYTFGNSMDKHRDRPACEYSLTIKLSDNRKGNWPIVIEGEEIFLEDGDAVLYKGCEVTHWRNKCEIEDYRLGQVFLHYVDANGPYENERYDAVLHGNYDKQQYFEKDLKEFLL